jgi:hypothetical protein
MMFVSERERAREDGYKMGGRGRLESKWRDIERLASVVGACVCVYVRVLCSVNAKVCGLTRCWSVGISLEPSFSWQP